MSDIRSTLPALVGLASVFALAACGAERDDRPAEAQTTTASAEATRYEAWGADMAEPELDGPVMLARELAVFSRRRKPEDAFPTEVVHLEPDPAEAEGRELGAQSRLLIAAVATEDIDELGPQRLSLYAVPTDRGWVCTYVVYEDLGDFADGMAGACEHGLVHGFGLELHGVGPWYRLYGVVEDDIERVSLRVGARLVPARVESNGIYFEADAREVCPVDIEELIVERADGRTEQVRWSELAPGVGASRDLFGCVR
jgi:hypothetical protein